MWSPKLDKLIEEDPFDGRHKSSPYQVTHYIATANSREGIEKVTLPPGFEATKYNDPKNLVHPQV